jgi:predicted Zn-dependent protease
VKKLLLVLFILLSATFIYLKVQVLGGENSSFNQTTRFKLGKYPWARSLFGLHNDGDARAWYLSGEGPIVVEVVKAEGVGVDERTLERFISDIEKYTGREVIMFNEEMFQRGRLSEADLDVVVNDHRHRAADSQPNLFIMFTEDFERQNGEVGKTYKEFGIVLSTTRLREISAAYPDSLSEYVESTLLHEFGHQIGLQHNEGIKCIMNEKVEKPNPGGLFGGYYTETEFCLEELNQLKQIKELY